MAHHSHRARRAKAGHGRMSLAGGADLFSNRPAGAVKG